MSKELKEIRIMPYSHHDFAWTNTRHWHIWRYLECFVEVLDLMKDNKNITWMIDNVVHSMTPFIKYCPERVEEFKMRVREGRIFVVNGGMSLARSTYVGEESFIRNMVEGKRFFQELFGLKNVEVFFNADTACGHSQLPQILGLGGHKYYRCWRPEEALDFKGVPKQFFWKGLDGSSILVSRGFYGGFIYGRYTNKDFENQWEEIKGEFFEEELKDRLNLLPTDMVWLNYGADDSFPQKNLFDESINIVGFIEEWKKRESTELKFSTPGEYFKKLSTKEVPSYEGSLDICDMVFNAPVNGNLSMWRMRKHLDGLMVKAESVAAFASILGAKYPEDKIKGLWKKLFEITGHAIEWTLREDFNNLYSNAKGAEAETIALIKDSCENIVNKISIDKGEQYVVFNSLNWERKAVVKLHITSPFGLKGFDLYDNKGKQVEYQIVETYTGGKMYSNVEYNSLDVIADVKVPPMGYTTLKAARNEKIAVIKKMETKAEGNELFDEKVFINNGCIEVVLEKGTILEIKKIGDDQRRISPRNKQDIHRLKFIRTMESGSYASSWEKVNEYALATESWNMIENGPVRWICRVRGKLGEQNVIEDIIINRGEYAVNFEVNIDSAGIEGYFAAGFLADTETQIFADIPFGVEKRDLSVEAYHKTSKSEWNSNEAERGWPGQYYAKNWTAFTCSGFPIAIISENCSIYYHHDKLNNEISLLLNRCLPFKNIGDSKVDNWMKQCTPALEGKGLHNFKYSLFLADKKNDFSGMVKFSKQLAQPMEIIPKFNYYSNDKLELEKALLETNSANIILSAFYKEDNDYIIRLYETKGAETELDVQMHFDFDEVEIVDFMGNKLKEYSFNYDKVGRIVKMKVKPWEIINVRLKTYRS